MSRDHKNNPTYEKLISDWLMECAILLNDVKEGLRAIEIGEQLVTEVFGVWFKGSEEIVVLMLILTMILIVFAKALACAWYSAHTSWFTLRLNVYFSPIFLFISWTIW